jgi:multiple sugar transport system substrate-binding protein
MTDFWVQCIKAGGADDWATYTWYKAAADLGARKAAMLFCADNMGWYQNIPGGSEEHGNIAWSTSPLPPGKNEIYSHFWSWALSINQSSKLKEASWLFIQYFTSKDYLLWAGVNAKQVDPVRQSVVNSPEYKKVLAQATGYEEVFDATIGGASILFTPEPHLTEVLVEWAGTIQDIVAGKYTSTQAGMDALKEKLDLIVEDVEVH